MNEDLRSMTLYHLLRQLTSVLRAGKLMSIGSLAEEVTRRLNDAPPADAVDYYYDLRLGKMK
jgi:hypothetical protein